MKFVSNSLIFLFVCFEYEVLLVYIWGKLNSLQESCNISFNKTKQLALLKSKYPFLKSLNQEPQVLLHAIRDARCWHLVAELGKRKGSHTHCEIY